MTTITLKNIPDSLYSNLKQAAKTNRRSINSEILVCLEKSLTPYRYQIDEHLTQARAVREALPDGFDPDDIAAAIEQGRP